MQHVGANADHGDYASKCDYCQRPYLRSELTRDRQGLLRCDEEDGREPKELDEANAASAKDPIPRGPNDGGYYQIVAADPDYVSLETLLGTLPDRGAGGL